jgi:hypothetical protein
LTALEPMLLPYNFRKVSKMSLRSPTSEAWTGPGRRGKDARDGLDPCSWARRVHCHKVMNTRHALARDSGLAHRNVEGETMESSRVWISSLSISLSINRASFPIRRMNSTNLRPPDPGFRKVQPGHTLAWSHRRNVFQQLLRTFEGT